MNDWQDRDRWNNERWREDRRNEADDDYRAMSDAGRRRYGYDEARDYWRSSEPRYSERHRGERSSEYSSLPGIGTNYGGGAWRNEYNQDWRRYGRPRGDYRNDDYRSRDERSRYASSWGRVDTRYAGRDYNRGHDNERGWWDRTKDEVRSWMGDEDAELRRQADHSGRGPKGYTRSDERIREDVSDRLMEDWEVDATDIEVVVAGAEVTLTGTVGDRPSKRRAEDIAANVLGVKDVQNSLRVRRVDPFATGREVASMTQGAASGATTGGTTTGTATSPTSPGPRH